MTTIKNHIFQEFKNGDILTKLLLINGACFLLLWVIEIIADITNTEIYSITKNILAAPTDGIALLKKPWTIVTYMFFDTSFLSLMCNMLFLFWMGRIFIDIINEEHLLATYILGGLAGVALPVLYSLITQTGTVLINPIAAVLAVTVAIATYAPSYKVFLLFFGEVSLKTLAIIIVVVELLPLLSIASTHFSNQVLAVTLCKIGGIVLGFSWAKLYTKGNDISEWVIQLYKKIDFSRKPKSNYRVYKNKKRDESYVDYEEVSPPSQEEIDCILKKISESGYDSLTKEEKETLFRQSKK